MSFAELHLDAALVRSLERAGYREPAPLHRAVLPPALAGRDVLAFGPSGSGKSVAIALPVLQRQQRTPATGVMALVLTEQLRRAVALEQLMHELRGPEARCCVLYGVAGLGALNQAAEQEYDIVISTPERLAAHTGRSYLNLGGVRLLVLDAADRMMARGLQPVLQRTLGALSSERQTLVFADAHSSELEAWAATLQRDPLVVRPDEGEVTPGGTAQVVWPVPEYLKRRLLDRLLDEYGMNRALVIVRDGSLATQLVRRMRARNHRAAALLPGFQAEQTHGARQGFQSGRVRLLVTTPDGLDEVEPDLVPYVVCYDIPQSVDECLALFARLPQAVFFHLMAPDEEHVIESIEGYIGRPLAREEVADFDYEAPSSSPARQPRRVARGQAAAEAPLLTWGDPSAARKDPAKIPLAEWNPGPLPAIWSQQVADEDSAGEGRRERGGRSGGRKRGGRSRRRGRRRRSGEGKRESADKGRQHAQQQPKRGPDRKAG